MADIDFEILAQNDASAFMPVTQEQISNLNQTSRDAIEVAFKLNNETIDELAKFQNNSRQRWNNLEKEVTPVLTIVLWSLVITSIVGIAIMAFQLIIICFRLAKMNAALQAARPDRDNTLFKDCLLYTSPSPRDKRQSRMPSSA